LPPVPTPRGSVAKGKTFPKQSIVSTYCVSNSVANTSVFEAATPMGPGTIAKGLGASGTSAVLGRANRLERVARRLELAA
jgi:hypothetical protein